MRSHRTTHRFADQVVSIRTRRVVWIKLPHGVSVSPTQRPRCRPYLPILDPALVVCFPTLHSHISHYQTVSTRIFLLIVVKDNIAAFSALVAEHLSRSRRQGACTAWWRRPCRHSREWGSALCLATPPGRRHHLSRRRSRQEELLSSAPPQANGAGPFSKGRGAAASQIASNYP